MGSNLITLSDFEVLVDGLSASGLGGVRVVAVGLSGGPDSLALAKLLSEWGAVYGVQVHALIVDHGLRAESAEEAQRVRDVVGAWENVDCFVLRWDGEKPDSKLMEEARRARYRLMAEYCCENRVSHLFLGHHADDQAETVLFRLSKGSGLDGLCGMRSVQKYDENLALVRPFLSVEKERLVATCDYYGLDYVRDPSNEKIEYARPRMREAREVLEREGLSTKRLGVTAMRLQRARLALDEIAEDVLDSACIRTGVDAVSLNWAAVRGYPEEIGFRVLIKVIRSLRFDADYLPRMEKIEDLFADLCSEGAFRKRTLGGLMFERDEKGYNLVVSKEV
ncbi:tRNA lysidine(34) synthetase TilS [Alphaproteobacteria bacterium]|nr:tRNA lysidine(34) synthetase TilS [Alphaproteobacteria bacterium]